MKLVKWNTFTRRHWQQGSRPSKRECMDLILEGVWEGRIAGDHVWVDEDHFLSAIAHHKPQAQSSASKTSGLFLLQ